LAALGIAVGFLANGGGDAEDLLAADTSEIESPSLVPEEIATATPPVSISTTPPSPTTTPALDATPVPTATPAPTVVEMTDNPLAYVEYRPVMDDEGTIEVEIPVEWSDIDGRKFFDDNGLEYFDVIAAPDIEAWSDTWDVPGIRITASRDLALTNNETSLADEFAATEFLESCVYEGRDPYDDGVYEGVIDFYAACGGTETMYVYIAAVPTHRAFVIQVQTQIVDDRDIEAMGRAIETYLIIDEGAVTGGS